MDYEDFFAEVTAGKQPYPYQRRLGEEPWPELLDVPTGKNNWNALWRVLYGRF